MRQTLILHPDSHCRAVKWIEVELVRASPTKLELNYKLAGWIGDLLIPEYSPPIRADGLWQHMCFELFLRALDEDDYLGFNFSPSTEWAVYRFTGYRAGMSNGPHRRQPRLDFRVGTNGVALVAEIGALPEANWHIGLSAVIEESDGNKSYWALAHPTGVPDFHHPDCFALEVPAVKAP